MNNRANKLKFAQAILIAISFVFTVPLISEGSDHFTRQQQWEEMAQEVDTWGDGLGSGLDEKIKDPVIALNLIGIASEQSCEGHLDWGLPYPWIQFVTDLPEMEEARKAMDAIVAELLIEESNLLAQFPDKSWEEIDLLPEAEKYMKLVSEWYGLDFKVEGAMAVHLEPLYKLLEKFYESKTSVVYDRVLVIINDGLYRLCSNGAGRQAGRSSEEREQKLKEYQQEMQDFSDFLKDSYLNS